jgi:putative transcriptional regulator
MSITHHPNDDILGRYATGRLGGAQRLVIDVHAVSCSHCRGTLEVFNRLGGEALEATDPVGMTEYAFDRVMAGVLASTLVDKHAHPDSTDLQDGPLPRALRNFPIGKRRRIAPGVSLRPIALPFSSESRLFLLRSAPGTKMLEHTHSGTEFTCVLSGSFVHEKGRYIPGDFDFGDSDVDHKPIVTDDGVCVCLVAMTGELKPNGWFGRLIAPFIRI